MHVAGRETSTTRNITMTGDMNVIMVTDITLLGAVVLEVVRRATVGQHHICHICMNAVVPATAAAMTRVEEAVLQTSGYLL